MGLLRRAVFRPAAGFSLRVRVGFVVGAAVARGRLGRGWLQRGDQRRELRGLENRRF